MYRIRADLIKIHKLKKKYLGNEKEKKNISDQLGCTICDLLLNRHTVQGIYLLTLSPLIVTGI